MIPTLQKTLTQIETHQESILPATDLRYLIENYRTGSFVPKVILYESYYNSPDGLFIPMSCPVVSETDVMQNKPSVWIWKPGRGPTESEFLSSSPAS